MTITCLLCSGGNNRKPSGTSRDYRERTWEHSALHPRDSNSIRGIRRAPPWRVLPFRRSRTRFESFVIISRKGSLDGTDDVLDCAQQRAVIGCATIITLSPAQMLEIQRPPGN